MNDRPISVTTEMEITRNSVNLKISFHTTSFLLIYIFYDLLQFLIIVQTLVAIDFVIRK